MGYYDRFLMHEDRRDKGMNSTTSEKGTDGKPNNSSEYNHDYYMKNKEKWQDDKDGAKHHEDLSDEEIAMQKDEKNRLGDSDWYGIQRPDGTWIVASEDICYEIPKGVSREELAKAMKDLDNSLNDAFENDPSMNFKKAVEMSGDHINKFLKGKKESSGEKEFDLDAAAMDVIRGKYKNGAERKAALGEDYEMVQKRVNELMKGQKSGSGSSSSSSNNKAATSSSTSTNSSEPHWRGKGGSSTSSTPAQNDQEKEEEKNKPAGRQRNITGSTSAPTRGSNSSGGRAGNVRHSEVYGNMNDWREYQDELFHHGIRGQKWGVRRFQNADGSLKSAGKARYYGDSDSYTASNGVKVGAPNSKGVAAFRKIQGSRLGSAAINGLAKANTAFYGHGTNKATWKRFEEQTRKENEAVREANRAHKQANANAKQQARLDRQAAKDQERAEYQKNLQDVRDSNSTKEKFLYNDATSRKAARILTKNKDVTLNEAKQQAHKEAVRNTAIIVGAYGAYKLGQLIVNNSNSNDRIASSPSFTPRKPSGTFKMPDLPTGSTSTNSNPFYETFKYAKF